jgi:TolB-like protein|tara:strand:+ start:837 stop:2921 length:2085 start_codon:yes stop_codon:yes gene_type:complete
VASSTFASFGIPVWAYRFVVLMLILGFPIALVIGWAFELTPDGIKTAKVAKGTASDTDDKELSTKRNLLTIAWAAGLPTVIFGALSLIFYFGVHTDSDSTDVRLAASSAERPYVLGTIAVLPFDVIGDGAETRVAGEGLHEELLTTLAEMDPLDVISRSSIMQFRADRPTIPEIGRTIGADFVIEGSIQAVNSKLRITVQLIEAETDNHLWAKTYDESLRKYEDLLVFQKRAAYELAIDAYRVLEGTFSAHGAAKAEREALIARITTEREGMLVNYWDDNQPETKLFVPLLEMQKEVLRLDPDNPEAHRVFVSIFGNAVWKGFRNQYDPVWHEEIYLASQRAISVLPDDYETNIVAGDYYNLYENNPHRAIFYYKKALENYEASEPEHIQPWPYNLLATAYLNTGQNFAAQRLIGRAEEQGSYVNFRERVEVYRSNRNREKVHETLDEGIRNAEQNGDRDIIAFALVMKAFNTSLDEGSIDEAVEVYDRLAGETEFPGFVSRSVLTMQRKYDEVIDHLSSIDTADTFWVMQQDLAIIRSWHYLKAGNRSLANSYLKSYLNELETSLKGRWMKRFSPDRYAIAYAEGLALLGDKDEALEWIEAALEAANPTRHYRDYFDTLFDCTYTYSHLGMAEESAQLIDQILSTQNGFTVGLFLVDPKFDSIRETPEFEAVMRKYMDQLRDSSVIESYYSVD